MPLLQKTNIWTCKPLWCLPWVYSVDSRVKDDSCDVMTYSHCSLTLFSASLRSQECIFSFNKGFMHHIPVHSWYPSLWGCQLLLMPSDLCVMSWKLYDSIWHFGYSLFFPHIRDWVVSFRLTMKFKYCHMSNIWCATYLMIQQSHFVYDKSSPNCVLSSYLFSESCLTFWANIQQFYALWASPDQCWFFLSTDINICWNSFGLKSLIEVVNSFETVSSCTKKQMWPFLWSRCPEEAWAHQVQKEGWKSFMIEIKAIKPTNRVLFSK